ncbi:MAG: bifunctional diaminohydroxyphosphoribosylaminopyrimidine deaminase/5-amino-6-(5-phosphoribosylamino)uracil reductase RibD [Propionibacteriales bacterium]|nr:bifunctional diaminohydroxyphosphoribosylaminopyrimidine deaminase/5-amino-6-(5-phosphoribosylamino)uracil reductase RibD [Propionibacteriales bacterium]
MNDTVDRSIVERAMRRALELAATPGVPHGPNPRVGCVLLAPDGSVIAEGFHRGAGTPHAEAAALTSAYELGGTDAARGATAVVTLEPCNHTGRTGPCAQALIRAGVARVVFAQPDPNPLAAGGAATLRSVGVAVETGLLEREARRLNRAWTFALEHGRPFVTWKLAATLDGRSAAADGSSKWITGELARQDVHRLRAECDAILVGTGTVIADNPALTVRDEIGDLVDHQPLRVVLGERDVPAGSRLLDGAAETLHLQTRDVPAAVSELHELGIQHVFVEGGPTVAAAFLAAGYVDEVVAYLAPKLLGSGRNAVGDLGIESITGALDLEVEDVTVLGHDVRITGRFRDRRQGAFLNQQEEKV